jgi:hypothetical protein
MVLIFKGHSPVLVLVIVTPILYTLICINDLTDKQTEGIVQWHECIIRTNWRYSTIIRLDPRCAPLSLYYAFSLSVLCTLVIVLYLQFVRVVHPCHCTMPSVCLCCAPLSLYYIFSLSVLSSRIIVLYLQFVRIMPNAYHHWCCEFESRSGRGAQHNVMKFVSDLRQIGRFFRVLRFPSSIKLNATI